MKYRAGYKYQLVETFIIVLPFAPSEDIVTDFIDFNRDGILKVRKDYAWDGPSGPTVDTPDSMVPSLVHDAGYQLMRNGLIPVATFKDLFDREFEKLCRDRGMANVRAEFWYLGVHDFGAGSCKPQQDNIIEVA